MRRRFCADGILHIYQRTVSGNNIFYSKEDFLVFFTIVSVYARKYKMTILGICLMIDHVHMLVSTGSRSQLSRFVSAYSTQFVKEFNASLSRTGSLFDENFGSAVKLDSKKIRSAIAYLFNNPVEKKLCRRSEEYRWSFLSYYTTGATRALSGKKYGRKVARAFSLINDIFQGNGYLKYSTLAIIFKGMSVKERDIIADYIIRLYFPIDIQKVTRYYKSYEDMLVAINSNTGSEYDLTEKHYGKTDVPYREIISFLKEKGITDTRSLIMLPTREKIRYHNILRHNTSASDIHIWKFLHMMREQT